MAHFEIMENFTKVPNEVFLIIKYVNNSSYIILIHIVRQTIGYGKKSDGISLSQFVEATRFSKRQIVKSIDELKNHRIIKVTKQTQKNGGKSYNRYELNLKGIDTLVNSMHKGSELNAQGVVNSMHKGSELNAHTKDNRQNTIEQKKRERLNPSFLYFKFSDSLKAKKTDEYLAHLIAESEYIKSETAFKIAIKKKLAREDKEQLQDFEEWYLNDECTKLLEAYKGTKVLHATKGLLEIKSIYTYFNTSGYNKDNYIYMSFVGRKEEDKEVMGFKNSTELERFIKDNEY